jgi:hypothetical protein
MDGKNILEQGIIRRIGTGEGTRIWQMNWLPRDGLLRPVCRSQGAQHLSLVSDLIDHTACSWRTDILEEAFAPMDREITQGIPRQQDDFWAWHYEKSDIFSVRSAYRMLVHNCYKRLAWLEHKAGRSDTKAEEKEWSTIWKVKVPSKIRIFLWRLARHSIPTRDVLHHCSICGMEDSWRHSLLDCNMSRCVCALEEEELVEHVIQLQEQDARGWLGQYLKRCRMAKQ